MKRIPKYILIFFFLLLIFGMSFNTLRGCHHEIISILKQGTADTSSSYVSVLETTMVEHLWKRAGLIEFSGLSRKLLNLHLTDDRQFYKDQDGIVHLTTKEKTYAPLINSAKYLASVLNEKDIPFLVCQIAERGNYSDIYSGLFDKKSTEYIQPLKMAVEGENAIYFDYATAFQKLGFRKEDIFFKTDIHYQTQAEFAILGEIIETLEKNSDIVFDNKELVLSLSNYRIEEYPFLGNLGASTGTVYTGLDSFVYYLPNYETSMKLENPSQSLIREGTFEQVCMNGYRNAPSNYRTYRVTDYMQYPSPYYIFTNNLLENNNVLIIGDSISMRTAAYLTLLCHSVTMLDPRSFNQNDYLKESLKQEYDAVLLFPSETLFNGIGGYDAEILSVHEIPENNGTFSLEVIVKNSGTMDWNGEESIRMTIWTGGLDVGIRSVIDPGVIVRPGEQYMFQIRHMDNGIVARALSIQMLKETRFYFGEKREIDLKDKISYALDAEIISTTAPANVKAEKKYTFDVTVKNNGTSAWSEQNQIRLAIWQDGQDHGYRLFLRDNDTVAPGESYTFIMENFNMPAPGETTLEFQMLEEGIEYFGEREPITIHTK